MECPRCHSTEFSLHSPCPDCQFSGDADLLERLSNLRFLLAEMALWPDLPLSLQKKLTERYGRQRRATEIELNLRRPPPDQDEAQSLRLQLSQQMALLDVLPNWQHQGWLSLAMLERLDRETNSSVDALRERFIDAPSAPHLTFTQRILNQREQKLFLLQTIEQLFTGGEITDRVRQTATGQLTNEITELEILAGLRERQITRPKREPKATKPPKDKKEKPPRRPWTWDRFWETLLSERTLQAILFLGVLLLFAAGISWVAWNWGTFPAVVQVAFLGAFTALFYALGWYVRARLQLRGSGIALSAVGSLLVPLDFYAFYLSGGFPPDSWPTVWLLGSVVCLVIYLLAAYLIQAEFFGYLVAAAAGSTVVAALNLFSIDTIWWPTGVAGLALALALVSEWLWPDSRSPQSGSWHILAAPFDRMALLGIVVTMVLEMGWGLFGEMARVLLRSFTLSLAFVWWLGGATLVLKVRRYRLRALVWGAALAFPVAVWLTERWFFLPSGIAAAWYAAGLALLTPIYLFIGFRLPSYGRIPLQVGGLLTAVSALWSLGDAAAAGWIHPLLAATMILAARWWRQPRWLWLTGLFLLSGSATWQGGRGAAVPELALPWALLAILFIVAAIRLRTAPIRYDAPLYGAGLAAAGLAILPPLTLFDQSLLTYALGNWIGINGWLAYLAHGQKSPGLQLMLASLFKRTRSTRINAEKTKIRTHPRGTRWFPSASQPIFFHWLAALSLLPWLWLMGTNNRPVTAPLALAYVVIAWLLLWLCQRLRRLWWGYGRVWQTTAHLSNLIAIIVGLVHYEQGWMVGVLWGTAVFYFAAAWVLHNVDWLYLGSLLFPIGWVLALDWVELPETSLPPAWAVVVLAHALVALWLKQRRARPRFYGHLINAAIIWGGLLAIFNILPLAVWPEADSVWIALAYALLGLSFGLIAWLQNEAIWGHVGVWLITGAGGIVVKIYSRGSGRSAALAALAAIIFILTERGLHYLALQGNSPQRTQRTQRFQQFSSAFLALFAVKTIRQAWRLYRMPLRFAGWTVSVLTIGWALLRNLYWLGGGVTRETWSAIALLMLVILYALSARLFRKPRFVTFASLLISIPWTLFTRLGWYVADAPRWPAYGLSWAILALLLLGTGILLAFRLGLGKWSWPPQIVAHLLLLFALTWSAEDVAVSAVTMGLAVLFYGTAVWMDRRLGTADPRFLYPAVFFAPVWAVYLLWHFVPDATATTTGLILLAFSLPALALGRRWARWEPAYRWPLYLLAYGSAIVATLQVTEARPFLIGFLFFDAGLALLSVWVFREPLWWYPATLLLPAALTLLLVEVELDETRFFGWMFIGLSLIYLIGAQQLTRHKLAWRQPAHFALPLLVMTFVLAAAGLLPASENRVGALVGFSMAAVVYTLIAIWKRWPLVLYVVMGMVSIAYGVALSLLDVPSDYWGLASWPGIGVILALAVALDRSWGIEPDVAGNRLAAFPWQNTNEWTTAVSQRLWRWWALPLYLTAFGSAALSGLLSVEGDWQWFTTLALGTAVYAWALTRFRLRGWLLLAWWWGQWTALALIRWIGWTDTPTQVALAFVPVTLVTAAAGWLIERFRQEGPPLGQNSRFWSGWSRPLYLLLLFNVGVGQLLALSGSGEGTAVTLLHALILAALATAWVWSPLTYPPLLLTFVALAQFMAWRDAPGTAWPPSLAVMALAYALIGYGVPFLRCLYDSVSPRLAVWRRPLQFSSWISSSISLLLAFVLGVRISTLIFRALLDVIVVRPSELPQVQMMILTLAILGLFYLTVALAERRQRVGYGALLLLLAAWSLWLLLIAQQRNLQLYALPASLYLLSIGWLEWQTGQHRLARWIDRAGLLLLFGSVFWQSFSQDGGWYALLMIVEGLLVVWLGSWRRLRRLLYAGVTAVVIAVVGQLIEPLLALNTFVLLLLGAALVALGIGLERRLETVRELSKDFRSRLEDWE